MSTERGEAKCEMSRRKAKCKTSGEKRKATSWARTAARHGETCRATYKQLTFAGAVRSRTLGHQRRNELKTTHNQDEGSQARASSIISARFSILFYFLVEPSSVFHQIFEQVFQELLEQLFLV